ncbi:PAS domain S-box protein [Methanolobus vulcani]|uniref:histidine kinase n=1 Tax=Methanolobus vulcani TaxID=38026 RepID=A0A7Z8KQH4_9EURY|nr:PAS domain-containing sensor histidine kinase [Methanolobus vulcani]TQD28232.1 PAS domain S-box protein [Methanolobus vulcani]
MTRSEDDLRKDDLRRKIIGLSETSHRKSYYPQLKEQINELSIAMDALQESEDKYRTLVENVNIGIFRTEPWEGGRILQANPALWQTLGFESEEEILSHPVDDIYLHMENRAELMDKLKQFGKIKDYKMEFKVRDGSTILCSLTLSAEYDSEGNIKFVDGVAEDITEKEKKSEALRQANNKLNVLSSITRHDIVNQVMVLEGYLLLLEEKVTSPEQIELIQKMKGSIRSVDRHIMFTRDYQEIGINAPEWVNLRDALKDAMISLDNFQVNIHMEPQDYMVFTDPMVWKVFYNIGNNVVKHSQAKNLYISTDEQDNQLLVVFQDDGIGIEDKKKLFKKGSSSSGYGLFLSKEILSITGIDIRETGLPDEGARFEIIFPQGQYKPVQ